MINLKKNQCLIYKDFPFYISLHCKIFYTYLTKLLYGHFIIFNFGNGDDNFATPEEGYAI